MQAVERPSIAIKLFAALFAFGAAMCALTIVLLLFPGSAVDALWRFNPEARLAFRALGAWAILLMATVGMACGLAAIGLLRQVRWGRWLALAILSLNLLGDTANALLRHDWRTLIGWPIGGAMIFYLWKTRPPIDR